jgi:hypothetical protein
MARMRVALSRDGQPLGARDPITLRNGTIVPAGVYTALCEAYVEMMRQKRVLTEIGTVDRSALLDADSVAKVQHDARLEATMAARPDRPTVPPSETRLLSAPSETVSYSGRYNRDFGDPGFVALEIDSRAHAEGSGYGGDLGAELGLWVTLPELGRIQILKEGVNVTVLQEMCRTRAEIGRFGRHVEIATDPHRLRSTAPWAGTQCLGSMRIAAFGLIPIEVTVNLIGSAGVSTQGTADSALSDTHKNQGILMTTLAPHAAKSDDARTEGLYARFALAGSAQVGLSLREAVEALAPFKQGLQEVVTVLVSADPGAWERNVGAAGASLSVQLAQVELRARGHHRLDFFPSERRGTRRVLTDRYVQSGAIDARLGARFLVDPTLQVFFRLSGPNRVDLDCGLPARSWSQLGSRYEVWGWEGPLFNQEVVILEQEWREAFGPNAWGVPARELELCHQQ